MQFQADMTGAVVSASTTEELSAIGAAYLAGIAAECYDKDRIFENISYKKFEPAMEPERKEEKRGAWKEAVKMIL